MSGFVAFTGGLQPLRIATLNPKSRGVAFVKCVQGVEALDRRWIERFTRCQFHRISGPVRRENSHPDAQLHREEVQPQ